jgi:lysylphosphatidylglycerol synthetase-like protein (DUF2156 family)
MIDSKEKLLALRIHSERAEPRDVLRAGEELRRDRATRSRASIAIAVVGIIDIVSAAMPPLRERLSLVLHIVPLAVPQIASALVGLSGLALLALAWGVRKGQRQAWTISVVLLIGTAVLHLIKGVELTESLLPLLILGYLVSGRHSFQTSVDLPSRRFAVLWLFFGTLTASVLATTGLEIFYTLDTPRTPLSFGEAYLAVTERMVGDQSIVLPARMNEFLSPSLASLGVGIVIVTLFLACRSVVARRRVQSVYAERRTRDLVRMHGAGTLDYFALRHDKQAFFFGDTVVTYGVYGGVCLVSPDPIGPEGERGAAWTSFRRFADGNGWTVAVLGAGEAWLSLYEMTGMRSLYVGDEAVVAVSDFSLQGGRHKGLRQAVNRISNYGYRVSFHDPATIAPELAHDLRVLSGISRRGDVERGFSMTLGRMFHPEDDGLLLAVATDRDGKAVAFCQFVPSPSIGGYSLDVMRRDTGDHPNGLFDFLIVSTIHYLDEEGFSGLGLNFATMRAVLAGEAGNGISVRFRRFVLSKLSRSMQIESLWRFNAKYDPTWIARYVVYGAAQELLPIAVAIVRAESLWDLPVIGKFFSPKRGKLPRITRLRDAA